MEAAEATVMVAGAEVLRTALPVGPEEEMVEGVEVYKVAKVGALWVEPRVA